MQGFSVLLHNNF